MRNSRQKQPRIQPAQHLPVRAVQLRQATDNERERDGLDEVGVGAAVDLQLVAVLGGRGRGARALADPVFAVQPAEDDAVGEQGEVEGEGEGEGACDGEEAGDGDADAEGGGC